MKSLNRLGSRALDSGIIVCLGNLFTHGLSAVEMWKEIFRNDCVGYWCPNLFSNTSFVPTRKQFKIAVIGGEKIADTKWQMGLVGNKASNFGLTRPSIEIVYYLWKLMQECKNGDRRLSGYSRFVVCHEPVQMGQDVCPRIASISNDLIVKAEIGGPGHHFDENTGFVYIISTV